MKRALLFLTMLLLAMAGHVELIQPAHAASSTGPYTVTTCTDISNPAAYQTWCFDMASGRLRVWDGAQYVTSPPIGPVLDPNDFPGADPGLKIQAAHDSPRCPIVGCIIDATVVSTASPLSAITITKPVSLEFGCGTIQFAGILAHDTSPRIAGKGECTNLTWNGSSTGYGIQCMGCRFGTQIRDLHISASTSKPMLAGVRIGNTLTTYSSQVLVDNVQVLCTDGGCLNPYQFDPFGATTTNSVSGSLNNTDPVITVAVGTCTGFTPATTMEVLISDRSHYELALLAPNGCNRGSMTLTRSNAFAHTGTQSLVMTLDGNNDLHTIRNSGAWNYTGCALSIEGGQSMLHKLESFSWGGNQVSGTKGICSGSDKILGGNFSINGKGGGGTDADIYLYNTAGVFTIEGLTLEDSVRFIETGNSNVLAPSKVEGNRWHSSRLNADKHVILWRLGGGFRLVGNDIVDSVSEAMDIYCQYPPCDARSNWLGSSSSTPFIGGPWAATGNVQADNAGVYVGLIADTLNASTLGNATWASPPAAGYGSSTPRPVYSSSHQTGTTGTIFTIVAGGAARNIADGATIAHGMASTPTNCLVTPSVANEIVAVTGLDASNITVAIKKRSDGSSGTSQTIYWGCTK